MKDGICEIIWYIVSPQNKWEKCKSRFVNRDINHVILVQRSASAGISQIVPYNNEISVWQSNVLRYLTDLFILAQDRIALTK